MKLIELRKQIENEKIKMRKNPEGLGSYLEKRDILNKIYLQATINVSEDKKIPILNLINRKDYLISIKEDLEETLNTESDSYSRVLQELNEINFILEEFNVGFEFEFKKEVKEEEKKEEIKDIKKPTPVPTRKKPTKKK